MPLVEGVAAPNLLVPLLLDSTGRALVVLDAVTNTPIKVSAGASGDKLFGFSADAGQVTALAAAVGANTITGAAVPAGKVWVVDAIDARDITTATTNVEIRVNTVTAATFAAVAFVATLAANVPLFVTGGPYVLSAGEFVTALFAGCLLNDGLRLRLHGYEMNAS